MAMLHIIRSSGFDHTALTQCLSMLLPNDSILLMDDGCYNVKHPLLLETLNTKPDTTIYVIELHTSARGLLPTTPEVANVNKPTFISITLSDALTQIFQHDNSITWS